MEYIDLQTGNMLLAFRSQQEVERAKAMFESRGLQTVCALAFEAMPEEAAATLVKHVAQAGKTYYWNYSNQSSGKLYDTAKASLGSALELSNAINGIPCDFLLIYEKEKPLLQALAPDKNRQAIPAV